MARNVRMLKYCNNSMKECYAGSLSWFRTFGNGNCKFDRHGLMQRRDACLNDMPIREAERKFHWPLGRRPIDHPGLSDLGL
jgi:nuclear transport factor 2 (NTF2) superfamily protein